MDKPGKLLFLLHAHLPFVREPKHERFLEENWLFEAISETYLPLIQVLNRLLEKGLPGVLNLSLSPTLIEMCQDPLLIHRYSKHLYMQLELIEKEMFLLKKDSQKMVVLRYYLQRQKSLIHTWENTCQKNLISTFIKMEELGILTILTCVGTHPFLPAYQSDLESIRFQLKVTVASYKKAFGRNPKGLWLPECGYFEGLDFILKEFGFEYFFLETHGILFAEPAPQYGVFSPIKTPAGLYCMGRDQKSSAEVWSRKTGYPGHPEYREFFKDIAFERDRDYLGEYFFAENTPIETGLKYNRITGSEQKQVYRPWNAMRLAQNHANLFISNREASFTDLFPHTKGHQAAILSPYDAELFGHWWFEGTIFIENLFERAAASPILELASVEEVMRSPLSSTVHKPVFSSWGEGGYSHVWMNEKVQSFYSQFFTMQAFFRNTHSLKPSVLLKRIQTQMMREILLFQASDWAFMVHNGSADAYAKSRFQEHYENVLKLYDLTRSKEPDLKLLETMENKNNLFAWIGELF